MRNGFILMPIIILPSFLFRLKPRYDTEIWFWAHINHKRFYQPIFLYLWILWFNVEIGIGIHPDALKLEWLSCSQALKPRAKSNASAKTKAETPLLMHIEERWWIILDQNKGNDRTEEVTSHQAWSSHSWLKSAGCDPENSEFVGSHRRTVMWFWQWVAFSYNISILISMCHIHHIPFQPKWKMVVNPLREGCSTKQFCYFVTRANTFQKNLLISATFRHLRLTLKMQEILYYLYVNRFIFKSTWSIKMVWMVESFGAEQLLHMTFLRFALKCDLNIQIRYLDHEIWWLDFTPSCCINNSFLDTVSAATLLMPWTCFLSA